jgi:hypothetical protein
MARALKAPKAATKTPKAPRKKKGRAQEGAHFVDDEGATADGPIYTEKLSPEELTAIAVEGMELQGKLDALENEENVLKEKAKIATKEVRKRIREVKSTVSRLAKENRNGVRELPAQTTIPGTEPPKRPSLRVVEEAKEISEWAAPSAPVDAAQAEDAIEVTATDAPLTATIAEHVEQEAAAPTEAPEAAPVAADPVDDGSDPF